MILNISTHGCITKVTINTIGDIGLIGTLRTGEYILINIPLKYLKEMYADFVGASRAYNKGNFEQ